MGLKVTPST